MRRNRRANTAVTALGLGVVLAFGALAVDVAYERVVNAQLQAAVDAGTLAAVARLDGTADGIEAARAVAAEIVRRNVVFGAYALEPDDVAFGSWDAEAGFTPSDPSEPAGIDAVRIVTEHHGIGAILARVAFGRDHLSTTARAVAARTVGGPASEVECYLPFALPVCAFEAAAGTLPPPMYVTFGPDKADNLAWAHGEIASKSNIEQQLDVFCTEPIRAGGSLHVNNGQVSNQLDQVAEIVNTAEDVLNHEGSDAVMPWPYQAFPDGPPLQGEPPDAFSHADSLVTNWGTVLGGPIPLVDIPCDDPDFKGTADIRGFTWGFIYDIRKGSAQEAGFMLQLDFLHPFAMGTASHPEAEGNLVLGEGAPVLVDP